MNSIPSLGLIGSHGIEGHCAAAPPQAGVGAGRDPSTPRTSHVVAAHDCLECQASWGGLRVPTSMDFGMRNGMQLMPHRISSIRRLKYSANIAVV